MHFLLFSTTQIAASDFLLGLRSWESHLGPVGGMDEGVRIFACQCLKYLKGSLTCRKILRQRTSGFISQPNEGGLRILIALKNPSSRPGLNPRPLVQW
jgi:hypothetical protein